MNEAALEAVRREGSLITSADIYNAMDRILQVRTKACMQTLLFVCEYVQQYGCLHQSCRGSPYTVMLPIVAAVAECV